MPSSFCLSSDTLCYPWNTTPTHLFGCPSYLAQAHILYPLLLPGVDILLTLPRLCARTSPLPIMQKPNIAQHPLLGPTLLSLYFTLALTSNSGLFSLWTPSLSHFDSDILCGLCSYIPFSPCLDSNILCLDTFSMGVFLYLILALTPFARLLFTSVQPFHPAHATLPPQSALLTLLWLLCPLLPQHTQMPTLLCSFWCLSTKLLYWREEKRRKQRPNVFYGNNVNQVYVWQKQIFPWCGSRYLENLEGAFGNLLKLHEWLGLLV